MFRSANLATAALRPANIVRRTTRRLAAASVVLTSALLSGCGGGVSFGFGAGVPFDNSPPSISLAAAATSVLAGQTISLVAAAADANGIDVVIIYRLDPGRQHPLATLSHPPYQLTVTAPTDGRQSLLVFARAIDNFGNRADSAVVEITILR